MSREPSTRLTSLTAAREAAIALGSAMAARHESVSLAAAAGRTVAIAPIAPIALPPFASSAMDGFAVRRADLTAASVATPVTLPVVAESRAGTPADVRLEPGTVVRIATGAVIPDGADAVVPYEQVQDDGERATFAVSPDAGAHVRGAGGDVAAGDRLAAVGERLRPGQLAALAGCGIATVEVRRAPRVSVLITGDEVVPAGATSGPLPPGAVHDVSGIVLPALIAEWGGEIAEIVRIHDDREATRAALDGAIGDVIVACGGLSMGPHDHVRPALAALDARQMLFRIALQPGKPTWIGALPAAGHRPERPVFGLPGNPASVFAVATLLLRPALEAALGRRVTLPLRARLAVAASSGFSGRTAAQRARISVSDDGALVVRPLPAQASHLLMPLGTANALALIPDGPELVAGEPVDVVPLGPADELAASPPIEEHPS